MEELNKKAVKRKARSYLGNDSIGLRNALDLFDLTGAILDHVTKEREELSDS